MGVERLIELGSTTTTSRDCTTRWRQSCVELTTRRKTTTEHQRRRCIDFFAPVNVVSTGADADAADAAKTLTYDRRPIRRRAYAVQSLLKVLSSRLLLSTTNFVDELFFSPHFQDKSFDVVTAAADDVAAVHLLRALGFP